MSARIIAPVVLGIVMLGLWEAAVCAAGIPPYILPGPILVAKTLVADWGTLAPSLLVTIEITVEALIAAVVVGGLPEEAAGSVYLFCSPDSDYVSGQCLVVNGGL